jgi:hypothetical protein
MSARKTSRFRKLAVLVGAMLLVTWLVGSGGFPLLMWSELNCWHQDVDIRSGRYRYQRYVLWCKVAEREEDTFLSRVYRKSFGGSPEPVWVRVNTFCPSSPHVSPQYAYHGALAQISLLEEILKLHGVTPEAEKAMVQAVLLLWQQDNGDGLATRYLRAILMREEGFAGPIGLKDLPDHRSLTAE